MVVDRRGFLGAGVGLAVAAGSATEARGEYAGVKAKSVFGSSTHYAGADPRASGAVERAMARRPFKVLFIGAHPDDADFQCGALAHKVCKAGGEAVFVSCSNGDKGHQWMTSPALAARRYGETQAAARVLGINRYLVMDHPDCQVENTRAFREEIIRLIRREAPNMVVTHRCSDYHADHRNVGLAVRDAAYLIGVPLYCPDAPVPEMLPFIVYAGDTFSEPRPFRADLVCGDDDVLDTLLETWACHVSQEFEWLPPECGYDPVKDVPPETDHRGRVAFLRDKMMPRRPTSNGRIHRRAIDAAWGGKGPTYAEVFELCEYARKPIPAELAFLRALPNVKCLGALA